MKPEDHVKKFWVNCTESGRLHASRFIPESEYRDFVIYLHRLGIIKYSKSHYVKIQLTGDSAKAMLNSVDTKYLKEKVRSELETYAEHKEFYS